MKTCTCGQKILPSWKTCNRCDPKPNKIKQVEKCIRILNDIKKSKPKEKMGIRTYKQGYYSGYQAGLDRAIFELAHFKEE